MQLQYLHRSGSKAETFCGLQTYLITPRCTKLVALQCKGSLVSMPSQTSRKPEGTRISDTIRWTTTTTTTLLAVFGAFVSSLASRCFGPARQLAVGFSRQFCVRWRFSSETSALAASPPASQPANQPALMSSCLAGGCLIRLFAVQCFLEW